MNLVENVVDKRGVCEDEDEGEHNEAEVKIYRTSTIVRIENLQIYLEF